MKKVVLKIMLGTIILEAILACLFILIGKFGDIGWKSMGSVAIIFICAIPCLFYSLIYEEKKYRKLTMIGASAVGIIALLDILMVWGIITSGEFLGKFSQTLNIIIWSLAFMSWVLSFLSPNQLLNRFKKISVALITILGFLTIIINWTGYFEGFITRLYYILIILTVASLISVLIITKIYKKEITRVGQSIANNNGNEPFEMKIENVQEIDSRGVNNVQNMNQQNALNPNENNPSNNNNNI